MSRRLARRSLLLSPLLVLGVVALAWGQTAPVPGLDKLTPEERALAERNLERWQKLTPEQRTRALENYRRWKSMTPEEREAARENYQRFHKLSREERARVLQDFQRWNELPEERRQSLQKEYERFQQLGRPQLYLPSSEISKEALVQELVAKEAIQEGAIVLLSCVEPCLSFRVRGDRQAKSLRLVME